MRFLTALLMLTLCVCATRKPAVAASNDKEVPPSTPDISSLFPLLAESRQMVLVLAPAYGATSATLYPLVRKEGRWQSAMPPMKAVVGRNGMAPLWEKREGDGRTPSGIYPLPLVYGYASSMETRMPYRQATENDLWVDDPDSPDYNRWVRKDDTTASSFEVMKLADDRYKYGIVIGYNMDPVIRGYGSAIFLHLWNEQQPTAGCVAVGEEDMLRLIRWLDPKEKPVAVLSAADDVDALAAGLATVVPSGASCNTANLLEDCGRKHADVRTKKGFRGAAFALPPSLRKEMVKKGSWREGCPVGLDDLAYLVMTYLGFDGRSHIGEMVVHSRLAGDVLDIFAGLYDNGFPIERMERIEKYDGDDDRSMAANNTSAFNCRDVSGRPGVLSRHSFGTAIDINPVQNPYLIPKRERLVQAGWDGEEDRSSFLERIGYSKNSALLDFCCKKHGNCSVLPPAGAGFLGRSASVKGLIREGDPLVDIFKAKGFEWGGEWRNVLDYQHFDFPVEKVIRKPDRR